MTQTPMGYLRHYDQVVETSISCNHLLFFTDVNDTGGYNFTDVKLTSLIYLEVSSPLVKEL